MKKEIDEGYTYIDFSDTEDTAWINQGGGSIYLTKDDMVALVKIITDKLTPSHTK